MAKVQLPSVNPNQLPLWNDIRIPDVFYTHFKQTGKCINCRQDLNHELHAYNHYKKWHLMKKASKSTGQKYYVWNIDKQIWLQTNLMIFIMAKMQKIPTAYTTR